MTKKDYKDLEFITAQLKGTVLGGSLMDVFDEAVKVLEGENFALAGALALHAYVTPRMSEDIDLVTTGDVTSISKKLTEAGFIEGSAFNVNTGKPGPLRILRFLKYGKILDLMFFENQEFAEELLRTALPKTVLGNSLKVLSPDGLALTKLISFRPQDIVDLQNLKPHLNQIYIEMWVKKLGIPQDQSQKIFSKYPMVDEILRRGNQGDDEEGCATKGTRY